MIENLEMDSVYANIASGIPPRLIMNKYLPKTSLLPSESVMALDIAAMIVNA